LPLTLASWVDGVAMRNLSLPSLAGQIPWYSLVSSLASGGIPQYNGAGNFVGLSGLSAYTVGTITLSSLDTERSFTGSTSYRECKSFKVVRSGTLSTTFDLAWTSGVGNVQGRIYRNGSAVGTERQVNDGASDVYSTFTEDISGWSVGDLCQLYVKSDTSSSVAGKAKNFKIKANIPTIETSVTDTALT